MVASGGVLSDGHGHGGPGVCLGDGQTEIYPKNTGITGLASAYMRLPERRPNGGRSTVARWTALSIFYVDCTLSLHDYDELRFQFSARPYKKMAALS